MATVLAGRGPGQAIGWSGARFGGSASRLDRLPILARGLSNGVAEALYCFIDGRIAIIAALQPGKLQLGLGRCSQARIRVAERGDNERLAGGSSR